MNIVVILIPISLLLGGAGLAAFIWSLKSRQYDDPEGSAARILMDDSPPIATRPRPRAENDTGTH
ncbi:MAG: cbb3-type cytochrome oxidase assembly protein CcoS [Pseudomonadota bacterium]